VRTGARATLTVSQRRAAGAAIAILFIALAQVAVWVVAQWEGGVLGLVDYLAQTFGWLVPAQVVLGGVAAWLSAR
jgi:hypothetical protein